MMQNAAFTAEAYKRQQIMTATPEGLTLMLYNGALRFMTEGMEAVKNKEHEKANIALIKAQSILLEFSTTLKMEYEISHQLLPLYNYCYDRLVEGNMKMDVEKIEEAKKIITELRNAWNEAMKSARKEKGVS